MAISAVISVGLSAASATMIVAAVAEVGLIMTAVGAVTGNKTLMKVGGVLGIVGGVGGLVAGAAEAGMAAAGEAAVAEGATEASIAAQSAAEVGGAQALSSTESSILGQSMAENAAQASFNSGAQAVATPIVAPSIAAEPLAPLAQETASSAAQTAAQDAASSATKSLYEPWESDFLSPSSGSPSTLEAAQSNIARPEAAFKNAGQGVSAPKSPADALPIMSDTESSILAQSQAQRGLQSSDSLFGRFWNGLDAKGKNDLLKIVSQIPGGIQESQNNDRLIGLKERELNLRSYGSALPIGIVRGARAA